jgi:hypothetical protein
MIRLTLGVALAALLAACSPRADTPSATPAAPTAASDYRTDLSMKELMAHVVDNAADGVWLNQGWIIFASHTDELFPTTDEGWMRTSNAALTLAETSNLLLLPGRPVDDNRVWIDASHMLYDAAMKAHEAAEKRDKEAFFDAGGEVYEACLKCHNRYIIGE